MGRLHDWLSLVRFSHSVFALPFALISAWIAGRGVPAGRTLLLVVLCAVAARTAATGFNRWLDRELDAKNPRTAGRELPAGRLRPAQVLALVVLSSGLFVAGAFLLNPLSGWLALPVLSVLLGYSAMKRVSCLAHGVLGLALGLAPLGAWVAVRGHLGGDLLPPFLLSGAVVAWVAGFDLIYACQDVEFDRRERLHSVPARFGVAGALRLSIALHLVTVVLLVLFGVRAELGWIYWTALLAAAALLVGQHALVAPDDLSRVDVAFFTFNGWVGVGLFLGTALDLAPWGAAR